MSCYRTHTAPTFHHETTNDVMNLYRNSHFWQEPPEPGSVHGIKCLVRSMEYQKQVLCLLPTFLLEPASPKISCLQSSAAFEATLTFSSSPSLEAWSEACGSKKPVPGLSPETRANMPRCCRRACGAFTLNRCMIVASLKSCVNLSVTQNEENSGPDDASSRVPPYLYIFSRK